MLIKIVNTQPGYAELAVSGEVDMAAADDLLRTATAALADNACDKLVLDLSQVTFIDSTGLGTLVAIRNATRDRAATLRLREPAPPVRRLMNITNLDSVFDICNGQS